MNLISRILPASSVILECDGDSKSVVFARAAELFQRLGGPSPKLIVDALVQREKLGSTGLGQGVAIPHGRIKGLKEALGGFVRMAKPIEFDAPDGKPVNLIFVMLVPAQANESHLQMLSELAQIFSDRSFREALMTASDPQAVSALFSDWTVHAANERSSAV